MRILYKVDNLDNVRTWEISVKDNTIYISYGIEHGAKITQAERILEGKGGRSLLQQIESRITSRINKQLDRGYYRDRQEALDNKGKNGMDTLAPMLAQKFMPDKVHDFKRARLQRKLDGNRLLVTKKDGELVAYSRNGKRIDTVYHILSALPEIAEGQTLDGELYIHGMALKDINSRIRRTQDGTTDLVYHIYDQIKDTDFVDRYEELKRMDFSSPHINLIQTWPYTTSTLDKDLIFARQEGYEGLMIRLDGYGYESGKRSRSLLKVKVREDAEWKVHDIRLTKEGLAKFVFLLDNGKTFTATAPGTKAEKLDAALYPEEYMGRKVTVSFAYYTAFGIPFHAVCERYYEDI